MKMLLTGASGFLGRNILKIANQSGLDVIAHSRSGVSWYSGRQITGDLASDQLTGNELSGVDCVIHAAGLAHQHGTPPGDRDFERVNVKATARMAQQAADAGVRQFIYISSASVYGGHSQPVTEDTACRPVSGYGLSKLRAEEAARSNLVASGCKLTIVRPATLYGYGDPGNMARMARAISSGFFFLPGRGHNLKSLSHVEVTAQAVIAIAQREGSNEAADTIVFNGPAEHYSVSDIVAALSAAMSCRNPISLPDTIGLSLVHSLRLLGTFSSRLSGLADSLKTLRRNDVYFDDRIQAAMGPFDQPDLEAGFRESYGNG